MPVLGVDGIGVTEIQHDGALRVRTRYVHARAAVRDAERLQEALAGPCAAAATTLEAIAIDDVRALSRPPG